jgi:hypothetical protein
MIRAFWLGLMAACAASSPGPGSWTSRPLPELDALFLPEKSAWRGGDAAYSVRLAPDRTLWLFGDTYIAPAGASGRAGSRMIRNTLAVQRGGTLEYFWRTRGEQPADAFPPASGPGWLWPLGGVRIGSRLHLFMMQMVSRGEGAFGFAVSQSVLLTVENPDDPPGAWKNTQRELPSRFGAAGADVFLGSACLLAEGALYAYGVHEGPGVGPGKGIILARIDPGAIEDPKAWRFFTGRDWSDDLERARDLFFEGAAEMSVTPFGGGVVALYTRGGLSADIVVRRAERPEGPFGDPEVVHRCPEPTWSRNYFCYAAKAHPELSREGADLVVSYAANSTDFAEAVRDLRIYRPRFVRVTRD